MNFLVQAARIYADSAPEYSQHFLYDFLQVSEKKMIRMYVLGYPVTNSSRKRSIRSASPSKRPSPSRPTWRAAPRTPPSPRSNKCKRSLLNDPWSSSHYRHPYRSLNQSLLLHIQIGLLVEQVPLIVLKLLIDVRSELRLLRLPHQLLVQGQRVVDGGDVLEVDGVGDLEAFHAVGVAPLLEVHLEGPAAPVAVVAADLALVLDAQAVQLVEPVGNRLAVPAEGQVLGVVNRRVGLLALR